MLTPDQEEERWRRKSDFSCRIPSLPSIPPRHVARWRWCARAWSNIRKVVVLFRRERSHNAQLFAPLAPRLWRSAAIHWMPLWSGTGPGSYARRARIGIAAAQGIALSRKVPVIGLPSVLVPNWSGLPDSFTVCGDARRGAFYVARVNSGALTEEISMHEATQLAQLREADAHGSWFTFDAKPPQGVSKVFVTTPSASRLALRAAQFSAGMQTLAATIPPEQIYLELHLPQDAQVATNSLTGRSKVNRKPAGATPTAVRDTPRHPPAS